MLVVHERNAFFLIQQKKIKGEVFFDYHLISFPIGIWLTETANGLMEPKFLAEIGGDYTTPQPLIQSDVRWGRIHRDYILTSILLGKNPCKFSGLQTWKEATDEP